MSKVVIKDSLYQRVKRAAVGEGYSSAEEFIEHAIENALRDVEVDQSEQQVEEQLRGLGYIE
jgi:hypothetical protein